MQTLMLSISIILLSRDSLSGFLQLDLPVGRNFLGLPTQLAYFGVGLDMDNSHISVSPRNGRRDEVLCEPASMVRS